MSLLFKFVRDTISYYQKSFIGIISHTLKFLFYKIASNTNTKITNIYSSTGSSLILSIMPILALWPRPFLNYYIYFPLIAVG